MTKKLAAIAALAMASMPATSMALAVPFTTTAVIGGMQTTQVEIVYVSPVPPIPPIIPGGGCKYRMTSFSPLGPNGGSAICKLVELNTLGGPLCNPNLNQATAVVSIPHRCETYLPGYFVPVDALLTLGEAPASPGGTVLVGIGFFDGFPMPLLVEI